MRGKLWKQRARGAGERGYKRQAYRRERQECKGTGRRRISRLPEVSGTAPVSPV